MYGDVRNAGDCAEKKKDGNIRAFSLIVKQKYENYRLLKQCNEG